MTEFNLSQAQQSRIQNRYNAFSADPTQENYQAFWETVYETGVFQKFGDNFEALAQEAPKLAMLLKGYTDEITGAIKDRNIALLDKYLNMDSDMLKGNIGSAEGILKFGRAITEFAQMIVAVFGMEGTPIADMVNKAEDAIQGRLESLRDELSDGKRDVIDRTSADTIAKDGFMQAIGDYRLGLNEMGGMMDHLDLTVRTTSGTSHAPTGSSLGSGRVSLEQFEELASVVSLPDDVRAELTSAARASARLGDPNALEIDANGVNEISGSLMGSDAVADMTDDQRTALSRDLRQFVPS